MRIFIALLFSESIKKQLQEYIEKLSQNYEGNFTSYDNLHLTLYYVGETNEDLLRNIVEKLRQISFNRFIYKTNKISSFKGNKNHRLVNILINENKRLNLLHFYVVKALRSAGVNVKSTNFTPHITLGRKVYINEDELAQIEIDELEISASRVSVMESKRVNDTLVYEEIEYIDLKK